MKIIFLILNTRGKYFYIYNIRLGKTKNIKKAKSILLVWLALNMYRYLKISASNKTKECKNKKLQNKFEFFFYCLATAQRSSGTIKYLDSLNFILKVKLLLGLNGKKIYKTMSTQVQQSNITGSDVLVS